MPLETVRISQSAREELLRLRRTTGLQNWNVLCRWAFCRSLQDPNVPPAVHITTDSSVEMTWKVFGGRYAEIYWALLRARLRRDEIPLTEENLAQHFRLHLHRGIGSLYASHRKKRLTALLSLAVPEETGANIPVAGADSEPEPTPTST